MLYRTPDAVKHCFARRDRLTKTDEFSSVFGFRRAIRGQWLMLHYQPRPVPHSEQQAPAALPQASGQTARLGLVVGKKLLKRAVDRNRLKRVVRENFRLRRPELPPCDLVVRLAVKGVPLCGAELADDVNALFDRLSSRLERQLGQAAEKPEKTGEALGQLVRQAPTKTGNAA